MYEAFVNWLVFNQNIFADGLMHSLTLPYKDYKLSSFQNKYHKNKHDHLVKGNFFSHKNKVII